jgi:tRNA modification GTPase
MLDGSRPFDEADQEVIDVVDGCRVLPVLNKADLSAVFDVSVLPADWPEPVRLSVKHDDDLSVLEKAIIALLGVNTISSEPPLISRARQRESLLRCEDSLACAEQGMRDGDGYEIVAMDIQHALSALQELAGEIVHDDILDMLFSDFCIGK